MRKQNAATRIARLFRSLSQPARLEILLAIGEGEACVCHLEAVLKLRQAYISQHLMALRQEGILAARREGRFVYYRLERAELTALILQAAHAAGITPEARQEAWGKKLLQGCPCPHCAPAAPEAAVTLPLGDIGSSLPTAEEKA
ncbi:MAG: metalloregulator ArsR/SmtB family transcription factor [Anaerolineales bacterium]|nr:metalloregulator ArsR/SmtB family transcription factor [Anaerolineales bacterium]